MQLIYDANIIVLEREYIYPNVYDKYLSVRFHWMHICVKKLQACRKYFYT